MTTRLRYYGVWASYIARSLVNGRAVRQCLLLYEQGFSWPFILRNWWR